MEFVTNLYTTVNTWLTENFGDLGPLLIIGVLGMFLILLTLPVMLRKEKDPFDQGQVLVLPAAVTFETQIQGDWIAGEGVRRAAIEVSGQLVEKQDQGEAPPWRVRQRIEFAASCGLAGCAVLPGQQPIAFLVVFEPPGQSVRNPVRVGPRVAEPLGQEGIDVEARGLGLGRGFRHRAPCSRRAGWPGASSSGAAPRRECR